MAKSSGGAGRIGRGGVNLNAGYNRPGSLANILQQRAANRVNLPKPREVSVALEFGRSNTRVPRIEPRNPASVFQRQRRQGSTVPITFVG